MYLRLAIALVTLLAITGCSGPAQDKFMDRSAPDALAAAQRALEKQGGYRLTVQQPNLVLPQWGGIEAGSITVNEDATSAVADLTRTGEPGATYHVTFHAGKTYFQRSTCNETFLISGGGADVLRPFLFERTKALAKATGAEFQGGGIRAVLEDIGLVTVLLDDRTSLPTEIVSIGSGRPLRWTFDRWGASPAAQPVPANLQQRGPGGIPC